MKNLEMKVEKHWDCPNCSVTHVSHDPHAVPLHICGGLRGGLTAPMVLAGTKCKIEAFDREDYISGDNVQRDSEGRPVMAVRTTRDDGEDCMVNVPVAMAHLRSD